MDRLQRAAMVHRATRIKLEKEIRAACERGESLRAVAAKVGWSHEQVRKIVRAKD